MTSENDKLLAEWVEPTPVFPNEIGETDYQLWLRWVGEPASLGGAWVLRRCEEGVQPQPPDFLHDEAASSLLRDKLMNTLSGFRIDRITTLSEPLKVRVCGYTRSKYISAEGDSFMAAIYATALKLAKEGR